MIILRPHEYRVLKPQIRLEWRTPSLAQPKSDMGHENQRRFRLTARLNDGHIRWRGWFDDREDADAFLHALGRHLVLGEPMPREVFDLPTPSWFPGFGEGLLYEFATLIFVVSGTSQTSPSDWNNGSNTVEGIGGGGSGACGVAASVVAAGAGGGEWRKIANFPVATPGTTAFNYTIGAGGTGVSSGAGNDGVQVTFNTSSLIAKPGLKGPTPTGTAAGGAGGTGGTGAAGNNNGGAGGARGGHTELSTGGGGAAGSTGVGNAGATATANDDGYAGGSADNGAAGAGAGGPGNSSGNATAGGAGTEWDASHGSGGGGGGAFADNNIGGAGGNYGGGGGAAYGSGCTSGAGKQGILVLTYTPISSFLRRRSPNAMQHLRR